MPKTLEDLSRFVDAETEALGPEAEAEREALRMRFRLAVALGERRVELGLTQAELAERVGIDQAEISRIENGNANPTTRTLMALLAALDTDIQLIPREAA